ncbi:MFS transporter, partial [Devosia sp.]|uniref:MFS transporter n=1 Tax=Devosia sp. TaxID=1871048 RepID=UPI001ACF73D0|nr:hypothetical protein [Devosia sp.]
PTAPPMTSARWRIIALFFTHALAAGAIHTRIPDLQVAMGLSEGQLALVLMGQPLGALTMFLFSRAIIARFGPRRAILAVLPIVIITAALATILLYPIALFALLALNGLGFSLSNIAMNVEADRVEAATGARVMNTCHGIWSVGFLLTSLLGATLRGMHVDPAIHLWALVPVLIALLLFVVVPMPVMPPRPHSGEKVKKLALPTLATLGLVAFGLGAGLTEGASRAWSIIYLRDNFEVSPFIESMALPALLAAMAAGRLLADGHAVGVGATWMKVGVMREAGALITDSQLHRPARRDLAARPFKRLVFQYRRIGRMFRARHRNQPGHTKKSLQPFLD